ncbi:MAG TPA: hypothetical protein VL401_02755, partial [Alphaproteobacteria bacterium]|nr:hypothetical protein [Alphaproteobacteria bacterium]
MKKKILFSILIISVISLLVFSIQQFRQIKSLTSQNLDLVTRMNSPREKSKNVSKNRLGNDWPVLMTKDISGGKLVAYQIDKNPMESLTGGIYAIVLELSSNNFYPLIYLF